VDNFQQIASRGELRTSRQVNIESYLEKMKQNQI